MYNGIILLRCVAAFFIVGCHLQLLPRTTGGCLVTSLCDMNVALFAAISGFLMACSLERNAALGGYFRRRAKRLLPTYVAWTVFYLLSSFVFATTIKGGILTSKYSNWRFWLDVVMWGGASCHLWFVICLFYANVLLGGCYVLCRRFTRCGFIFMILGIIFVTCSTLQRTFLLTYPCRLFGFVSLGIALRLALCNIRIPCLASCVLMAVSVCAYFILSGFAHPFLRDMMLVLAILLWCSRKDMPLYGGTTVEHLSNCSMGVFLIHPFFAAGMAALVSHVWAPPFGIGIVTADWIVVYFMSLTATLVIRKIPKLNMLMK